MAPNDAVHPIDRHDICTCEWCHRSLLCRIFCI